MDMTLRSHLYLIRATLKELRMLLLSITVLVGGIMAPPSFLLPTAMIASMLLVVATTHLAYKVYAQIDINMEYSRYAIDGDVLYAELDIVPRTVEAPDGSLFDVVARKKAAPKKRTQKVRTATTPKRPKNIPESFTFNPHSGMWEQPRNHKPIPESGQWGFPDDDEV